MCKKPYCVKLIIVVIVLAGMSFFLFFRLGHHALWDDEAIVALFAESVWRTGDTSAVLDHNILAYRSGACLRGLHYRYIPPLHFYLAAPFVGIAGRSTFAARLPFAFCGLLTVAIILFWLWKGRASMSIWLLTSAGLLGNVSFMLHSRQCRYYAPVILFTTILAFLYFFRDNRRRTMMAIILTSLLLLASNYMCYVAAYACLTADYLIWGRKTRPVQNRDLMIIFIPQLVLGGLLINIYNPLRMNIWGTAVNLGLLKHKVILFFWNLRELNNCEFGIGILMLIAPLLYLYKKDKRLLRGPMAILIYCFVIAVVSPQALGMSRAIVRYLCPLIPLCIFISALTIEVLTARLKWLVFPLAILAFGTNVLHGGPIAGAYKVYMGRGIADVGFRSTAVEFIHELFSPPPSVNRAAADWINRNVRNHESIWVMPGFVAYPLIYHAPKATYAWQLQEESGQFSGLPPIHFIERIPPQYVIAFGPYVSEVKDMFQKLEKRNIHYVQVEHLDMYWYDLIRPELYWHSFREIKNFSADEEAVNIYKFDPK